MEAAFTGFEVTFGTTVTFLTTGVVFTASFIALAFLSIRALFSASSRAFFSFASLIALVSSAFLFAIAASSALRFAAASSAAFFFSAAANIWCTK